MRDAFSIHWIAISAACSILFVLASRQFALHFGFLLDHPNHRSLHQQATPRTGGMAIWGASALTIFWVGLALPMLLIAGTCLLIAISLLDDWKSQSVGLRLSVQIVSASLVVGWMDLPPIWLAVGITVTVWAGNLLNFMDGADGLAATMMTLGLAALGWLAYLGDHPSALLALVIAAALMGFLLFNLPPATVFMGDAGSVPLGVVAATISIWGIRDNLWPAWFPVMVFMPLIADATWTLARRIAQGKPFWQAHREHLYQRCVLAGWSHGKLLMRSTALALVLIGLSFLLLAAPPHWQSVGFLLACLLLATIFAAVSARVASAEK